MKITGIILAIIGGLSTLGGIIAAANGKGTPFGGLAFLVLGIFLISRAEKKKKEEAEKKKWENNE